MTTERDKTFVAFGFGPIAAGLFLYEARASGNFDRLVVAEIDAELVQAVRQAGGAYTVNVARADRIDPVEVGGVEILNPRDAGDREALVAAIAVSDELATCLPNVDVYAAGGEASVVNLLAGGLARRAEPIDTVLYAAENHNHAAELLRKQVAALAPGAALARTQMANTVIGKMSGVIRDTDAMGRLGLAPLTPTADRAVLVEEFNRILISRIDWPGYCRGLDVFEAKADLLPFEEAKLYGHNAAHALLGYLAALRGLTTIAEAGHDEDVMAHARAAFLGECGVGLVARHRATGDALFTAEGFQDYAEDLLMRMTNPHLHDLVDRVCRDPVRKLGWGDRLVGAMRLARHAGVEPTHLAPGAAAALVWIVRHRPDVPNAPASLPQAEGDLTETSVAQVLGEIWGGGKSGGADEGARTAISELVWDGLAALREQGFGLG